MWYPTKELRQVFFMKPVPEVLTNKQRVTRQYKRVLTTLKDHAGNYRQYYVNDVGEARYQYEIRRNLTSPQEIDYAVEQGEQWLKKWAFYAPYRIPYLPDGSKWQRNQTIPEELDSENRLIDWEAEIQPEFEDTKSDLSLSWKVEE